MFKVLLALPVLAAFGAMAVVVLSVVLAIWGAAFAIELALGLLCRRARLLRRSLLRLRRSLMPLLWHGLRQRRALQILLQKRVIILFRLRTVLRRLAVGIITQERDLVLV